MLSWGEMAKNRKKGKSKDEEPAEAKGQDKGPDQSKLPKSQAAAQKPAPKPRPKSAAERKKDQIDGIKKTVYPAVLGVLAGFACYYAPAATINQLPWHFVLLVVLAVTYFIQKVTYPLLKIDASEFNGKDWFYVEFMAIDLWLVTWTLLLN
jgi:phage shock protein PspC (stress-responsive transcriptional regulator)